MIRHLTPADYRQMAWANGKGVTVEMLRIETDAGLQYRISRASVVEAGEFSIFPQIERNLTVISGPGFDLRGDGVAMQALPLQPIAFAGDLPLRAVAVTAPSDDFNVMSARALPHPKVTVHAAPETLPKGGILAIFALGQGVVNDLPVGKYDLILTDQAARIDGRFILARLQQARWADLAA
ncbi:HutD family protein [Cypionkella sp.]|uniref:HutD/Ves family protein n=1 Tax=Cypionkella sp. TaxID=2811411 RepID=UPI003752CB74